MLGEICYLIRFRQRVPFLFSSFVPASLSLGSRGRLYYSSVVGWVKKKGWAVKKVRNDKHSRCFKFTWFLPWRGDPDGRCFKLDYYSIILIESVGDLGRGMGTSRARERVVATDAMRATVPFFSCTAALRYAGPEKS